MADYYPRSTNHVARVTAQGEGLYMTVTRTMAQRLGWKRGDRIAVDTDGHVMWCVRIPLDVMLAHAAESAGVAAQRERAQKVMGANREASPAEALQG